VVGSCRCSLFNDIVWDADELGSTWLGHPIECSHGKPIYTLSGESLILQISYTIAILLSLINIGSTIAFNVISSLGVGALLSSYIVSISCITLKRLRGEALVRSSFSLGRAGLPINIFSVLFLVLAFVLAFFPQSPHPEAKDMNWSIVVYGAVVLFSVVYFAVWGRKRYLGPVVYVRKDW
jgi:choline transport protein